MDRRRAEVEKALWERALCAKARRAMMEAMAERFELFVIVTGWLWFGFGLSKSGFSFGCLGRKDFEGGTMWKVDKWDWLGLLAI